MKMKRTVWAGALIALMSLGGCYSTTYVAKSRQPSTVKVEQKMDFYWWGLSGQGEINVAQSCGDRGAARINTQHTAVNTLLGIVTLGIYVPRTAFITCGQTEGSST